MFGDPFENPKGYVKKTIGDVCDFQGGSQPPRKEFVFKPQEGYVRLIQIRDYKTDDYITYAPEKMCRRFCDADDIMIGRYGPPIFQILQGIEGAYNVALMKAIPHGINKEFMRAYLKRDELLHHLELFSTRTAGQSGIEMSELRGYPCLVPPEEEQLQYVEFVKQSDKSKFVRFKSQFIEMFGEDGEKRNCVTKTLQELIDMKWITYHLDGNHGGDYPRADEFVEAGIPYISANCIVGDRIDMKLAKYVTAERAKRFRKGIAENGDVLFAHNATVGPVAILETEEPTVILGTSLTSYRCNSNHILAEYLMAYMKNPLFVQQYERNMQQSTRKQVPITTQRKYSFIIPSMDEQKEFAHFVKQSDKSKLKEEDHKSGMHEL